MKTEAARALKNSKETGETDGYKLNTAFELRKLSTKKQALKRQRHEAKRGLSRIWF